MKARWGVLDSLRTTSLANKKITLLPAGAAHQASSTPAHNNIRGKPSLRPTHPFPTIDRFRSSGVSLENQASRKIYDFSKRRKRRKRLEQEEGLEQVRREGG